MLLWRLREPDKEENLKETVDKDVNDFHSKPSDTLDRCKQREMIRGNWSDSNSDAS